MQVFCRNGREDSSPGCMQCLGERENISFEKGDYTVYTCTVFLALSLFWDWPVQCDIVVSDEKCKPF